jgi:phosphoglycerate-specific signal transduction histidine kinase
MDRFKKEYPEVISPIKDLFGWTEACASAATTAEEPAAAGNPVAAFIRSEEYCWAKLLFNLLGYWDTAHDFVRGFRKRKGGVNQIRDFLELAKEISAFNLKGSIDSVLTLLWNKIKQGAEVINNVSDEIYITTNQEELSQVWTNIINNALQASNNSCKIEISYLLERDYHIIAIKNNGPEIPKDIIGNIFDEFFTTKKRGEGTGLGLNIVKKIIEKNKGLIECFSNSLETKFVISLPIKNE